MEKYICSKCRQECFGESDKYPEIVFQDRMNNIIICEDCSIDYEEVDGVLKLRKEF